MKTLKAILNWILGKKEVEAQSAPEAPAKETPTEVTATISAPTIAEHNFDFKEVDTTKKTPKKSTKKTTAKKAVKKTTTKKKK